MTEQEKTIMECLEVFLGDYPPERQYACSILLHTILKDKKYKELMRTIKEVTGFKVNDRNDSKVVMWKRKIKKRGKCEICESKEKLETHHKVPWEHSIKGRTDINNGMCLCQECHKMIHNDAQWIEYMRVKYYGQK